MPRGQKPKPLSLRIAEGDRSGIGVHKLDDLAARVPKASRGIPDPPSHVKGLAREQWLIWREELELMGIDYSADAVVLEGACVNYARAIQMDHLIELDGELIEEDLRDRVTSQVIWTRLRKHPAVAISNACWKQVHMFCSELGLSIVSRTRLAVDSETSRGATDKLMALLVSPPIEKHRDPESGEMIIKDPSADPPVN